MKILITGGAGFIGSNLLDHFLELGHEVVSLHDLYVLLFRAFDGKAGYKHNINHHFDNPKFTFTKGNIGLFVLKDR